MAFNGSGVFNRLYNWANDKAAGIKIRADRMDNEMNGFATGLSTCITKDGQTTITADLPMAGYKHTSVGEAALRNEYSALSQVQDGVVNWAASGGTADAITATFSPTFSSLKDGQICFVRASFANATTTPTFSPNGITARTIVKNGNQPLLIKDIYGAGHEMVLRYNLAGTRWELLNPAQNFDTITSTGSAGTVFKNSTGATVATFGNSGTTDVSFAGNLNTSGNSTFTGAAAFANALNTARATAVASASTVDLGVTAGNFLHITGTTTITSFGSTGTAGAWRFVTFDGSLTLTHNSTSLILPTGANIQTSSNDSAIFVYEGSGNWRCLNYSKASGVLIPTIVRATSTTQTSTTSVIPNDSSIPQNTEGTEFLTATITPRSTNNILVIEVTIPIIGMSTNSNWSGAIFQDSTANALCAGTITPTNNTYEQQFTLKYTMTAGTTSATTFKFRYGPSSGTAYILRGSGTVAFGGTAVATMTITEYPV